MMNWHRYAATLEFLYIFQNAIQENAIFFFAFRKISAMISEEYTGFAYIADHSHRIRNGLATHS